MDILKRGPLVNALKQLTFPLLGLAALLWFLVRVIPKPSRAAYPCQRAAAPLASGFVVWLLGSTLALAQARQRFQEARYLLAGLCLLAGLAVAMAGPVLARQPLTYAAYAPHPANQPLGTARGLQPGRVAWVYDPDVTDWAGPGTGERWYEQTDQAVAEAMFSHALQGYTGQPTDAAAWTAIFRHFNQSSAGYTPGEKIAIKINLTTAFARGSGLADENYNQKVAAGVDLDSTANSPQLLHALLDQLVNVVGVAETDITIGDPTGLFVNYLYEPLHNDFPNVHYLDNRGTLGRTKAEFSNAPFYWSTAAADGKLQDYIPVSFHEASYIINFALLKSHYDAGITVTAKNHYGSLLRCPDGYLREAGTLDYYNMHASVPGFDGPAGLGHYRALVDLMGHTDLGGKTLLYLIDGLFGGRGWNSVPSKWSMPPFNNDWPSSLFLSMDPVAIDSVGNDFLVEQWPEDARQAEGVEDYLHEAALADLPPSGTFYDPERDGLPLASLGVHEHWNSLTYKQYSRNLGTGHGIELIALGDIPVSVGVRATDGLAVEQGTETGRFTISRAGDMSQALNVSYSVNGTATPGSDYQPLSGAVTIPAGHSSAPVTVVPLWDSSKEPAERVILTLLAGNYTVITATQTATVTILDHSKQTFLPIIL